MAILASFVHCLPNILHDSLTWCDCRWPWRYFKIIKLFHIKFLVNGALYGKSDYRVLIVNHTLVFDWCHVWWLWSTFEGHFSLVCHFHVHFCNLWHAFASRGLPAIAELLVRVLNTQHIRGVCAIQIYDLLTYSLVGFLPREATRSAVLP